MRNLEEFRPGASTVPISYRLWVGQNESGGLYERIETSKPTADYEDFRAFVAYAQGLWTSSTRAWNTVRHPTSSSPYWLFRVDGSADSNPQRSSALQNYDGACQRL